MGEEGGSYGDRKVSTPYPNTLISLLTLLLSAAVNDKLRARASYFMCASMLACITFDHNQQRKQQAPEKL